jgi:hypothetical protein
MNCLSRIKILPFEILPIKILPKDMIIIIAKFVYGDKKVVVRKDGHVSFRILETVPSLSKIRQFSVYLSFDSRDGIAHVNTKSAFLGKKIIQKNEIGWEDATYHTNCSFEDEPKYRRKEYVITIRRDLTSKQNIYEFRTSVMLFCGEDSWGQLISSEQHKYLVEDTNEGQHYIKSNRIL